MVLPILSIHDKKKTVIKSLSTVKHPNFRQWRNFRHFAKKKKNLNLLEDSKIFAKNKNVHRYGNLQTIMYKFY